MLISFAPPPLHGLSDLGDPFGITNAIGLVSNFFAEQKRAKIAEKQIAVEQQVLKQQKVVDAHNFAAQQAEALVSASNKKRQDQMLALMAVGGAAVLISGIFIFGAVKK